MYRDVSVCIGMYRNVSVYVSVIECINARYACRYIYDTTTIHVLDTVCDTVASVVLRYEYDTRPIQTARHADDTVIWTCLDVSGHVWIQPRYICDTNTDTIRIQFAFDTRTISYDTLYRNTIQADPRISF